MAPSLTKMQPLQKSRVSFHRKLHSLHIYAVLLGTLWLCTSQANAEGYRRVARKLSSPLDPDLLEGQLSNEDLHSLLSILEGRQVPTTPEATTTPRTIHPELIRTHAPTTTIPTTTTTEQPPVSRVTTRRFYRRLRRKPTTSATTETPTVPSSTTIREHVVEEAGSGRMLPSAGPGELLNQLSLLNGFLGALNSTSEPAAPPPSQPNINAPTVTPTNDNANKDNATSVDDILAFLTGAKTDASSKSEVVVPPPPSPSSNSQMDDNTASALALLNLFSGGSSNENKDGGSSAGNLLNLVAQSQAASQSQQGSPMSDSEATAALTKLLLQSSAPSAQSMQGHSIVQQQQPNGDSANQLSSLLGLLGTLGAAAGGGLNQQQSHAGNINNLFSLGGDQQTAQAQQANSLASLFGNGKQQQSQQQQAQNLLNLFGGNQAGQGFSLSSLLAPQANTNAIPGLGLLSTMSSLGSSIFSTVSNIFGGSQTGGKPRVRGKGVDTRVGLGYRLGNVGDAQIVWDIGPQLFTDPLRGEGRPYGNKKRESGIPATAYLPPASAAAAEKEVQQTEAKRRMVQSAIRDNYRTDYNQFSGVYPSKFRRSHSPFDYSSTIRPRSFSYDYTTTKPYYYQASSSSPPPTTTKSFFLKSLTLPFADHLKGFWSGLTSGIVGEEEVEPSTTPSYYSGFDDIRTDFSNNLIKRSSPDYTDFESRAYNPRRMDDYDDTDDPNHSTLTDYERMLLQYGKDMGIGGVADTRHGVIEEPKPTEASIFSRWFKSASSTPSKNQDEEVNIPFRPMPTSQGSEWGYGSATSSSDEYPVVQQPYKTLKPKKTSSPFGHDLSFNRGNTNDQRRRNNKDNSQHQRPRPQQRRSHNPFRNWFSALKPTSSSKHHHNHKHHGHGQRPRSSQHSSSSSYGFGRRHYKQRPGNPKLQHFTNTNKDLMMADANIDDFVESAGFDSLPGAYDQPMAYGYPNQFTEVPQTQPPRRLRPSDLTTAAYRASLGQIEQNVEPALLYDHLEVMDTKSHAEEDESFHNRNKIIQNAKLKELEKQKVLGTTASTGRVTKLPVSLSKLQKMRLNKMRANATGIRGKQRIVVKIKGKGTNIQYKGTPAALAAMAGSGSGNNGHVSESTTAFPSVMSTIGSMLLTNMLQNATSFLPSISSMRILPRKRKKEQKPKITLQNGRPAVVIPQEEEDEEEDMQPEGGELSPVVHLGEDMSFTDIQSLFGGSQNNNENNSTKRRRFRIRVKESLLKGDKDEATERKDSEEEDDPDATKDIFVDIESGEVSVLKPVASLVSFSPKKEEPSDEEEVDYYEDDDGDGVADMDMKRKEHIFDAIQKELVKNFEKIKKAELKAEAKKRRKEELAQKGMDESMDVVTKLFNLHQDDGYAQEQSRKEPKMKNAGGLSL